MTEEWAEEKAEEVEDNIDQMRKGQPPFITNVKLDVEEEALPLITGEGTAELRVVIKPDIPIPYPDQYETFYLVKVDGEWKIASSVRD